jgi:hypothetical protein
MPKISRAGRIKILLNNFIKTRGFDLIKNLKERIPKTNENQRFKGLTIIKFTMINNYTHSKEIGCCSRRLYC